MRKNEELKRLEEELSKYRKAEEASLHTEHLKELTTLWEENAKWQKADSDAVKAVFAENNTLKEKVKELEKTVGTPEHITVIREAFERDWKKNFEKTESNLKFATESLKQARDCMVEAYGQHMDCEKATDEEHQMMRILQEGYIRASNALTQIKDGGV